MRLKQAFIIAQLLWVLLVLATLANATTYWASTSGSGATCGTTGTNDPGSGYTTYLKGVTCLATGDTLILRSGTYANDLDTNVTSLVSGSSYTDAPVIKAKDGETAIVRSLNITGGRHHIIFGSTAGSLVFDAQGSTSFNDLVSVGANSSHHIRFINVEIRNNTNGQLVSINELGSFMEFLGGHFHDATGNPSAAPQGGYCFYVIGDDNLIENAELNDCTGFGIHNYSAHAGLPDRNVYRNNRVHDMQAGSGYLAGAGILLGSGDSNLAHNNLIYNNTAEGMQIGNGSTNSKAYNNTIYNNGYTANNGAGCVVYGDDSGSIIQNNICNNNAGSTFYDANPGGTTPTFGGNLCSSAGTGCAANGDPLFTDAANGDFTLGVSSPAIDTAIDLGSSYNTDYAGITRPQGPGWDIGAYEFRRTYYVSKTGSDAHACSTTDSSGTNKLTIAAGIGCLSSGDTLVIHTGTYVETINLINIPSGGGSYASATTIQSATGESVIIQPSSAGGIACVAAACTQSYIIFKNLDVDGRNAAGSPNISVSGQSPGATVNHIRFDGVNTYDNGLNTPANDQPQAGALIEFCNDCEFINGSSHDNGTSANPYNFDGRQAPYGFYWHGLRGLISGNQIYNNGAYGIHAYTGHGDRIDDMVITGNNIYNNGDHYYNASAVLGQGSAAILASVGDHYVIYNNIINTGPNQDGIAIPNTSGGACSSAPNCAVHSNTIYGLAKTGLFIDTGSTAITAKNNILMNNLTNISLLNGSATLSNNLCNGTGGTTDCNLTSNPLFTNAGGSDFTLQSSSPAIDAGASLGSPYNTDYAGVTRPQGSGWDIGAYEYFGGGPPPPLPALVASYGFASSGLPQDSSGNANHATTMAAGVTWTNSGCKFGGCLVFDGTGGVTVPTSSSLELGFFTIEAWVKQTISPPTDFKAIVTHDNGGSINYYYLFASSATYACANSAPFGGWSSTTNGACDSATLTQDTWTFLTVTYDGTYTKFYRNASLINTTTAATMIAGAGTLYLGTSFYDEHFTGYMDNVRIYNYARTLSEITTDMDSPIGGEIFLRVGDRGLKLGDRLLRIGQQ